ncbi:hypothetical protein BH10ACI3_BH10ACI3_02420 [soil metagenome]
MIGEITAIITGVKTLRDIGTSFQDIKTGDAVRERTAEMNTVIIDIQNAVMNIQSQNHILIDENIRLKTELANVKNWNEEKNLYMLHTIADNVWIYVEKAKFNSSEGMVGYCVNCFEDGRKAIIQKMHKTRQGTFFECSHCKSKLIDPDDHLPKLKSHSF